MGHEQPKTKIDLPDEGSSDTVVMTRRLCEPEIMV